MSTTLPLWTPSPEQVGGVPARRLPPPGRRAPRLDLPDSPALHRWSVEHPDELLAGGVGQPRRDRRPGRRRLRPGRRHDARRPLLPRRAAQLRREHAGGPARRRPSRRSSSSARTASGASLSWAQLRVEVGATAAALRAAGVGRATGSRPGCRTCPRRWSPCWPRSPSAPSSRRRRPTSARPAWSTASARSSPRSLLAADGYLYGGKQFDCLARLAEIVAALPDACGDVVVVGNLAERARHRRRSPMPSPTTRDLHRIAGGARRRSTRFPFDHPASCSTPRARPASRSASSTGRRRPAQAPERAPAPLRRPARRPRLLLHDLRLDDVELAACRRSAVGPRSCSTTAARSIPARRCSSTSPTATSVTLLGVSAKFIDSLRKAGPAPPRHPRPRHGADASARPDRRCHAEGFDYVYDAVKPDVHLASISGGTDLCGCFVAGDPTRPVWRGRDPGPGPRAWRSTCRTTTARRSPTGRASWSAPSPFPSMPLGFWGDADGSRYRGRVLRALPRRVGPRRLRLVDRRTAAW